MSDTPVASSSSSESRLLGRCKWFNSKSGFGFITLLEGENASKDIFVHYSCIRAESSQYKYLVQGEYVEFDLVNTENDKHEFHAANVTGLKGGPLMCDTHCLNNTAPRTYSSRPQSSQPRRHAYDDSRQMQQPRDDAPVSAEGFVEVKRKGPTKKRSYASIV